MNEEISIFLKEAINLEMNMSDLYRLFSVKFQQDSEFWWKISLEEVNHAALIRSINDIYLPEKILPNGSITEKTEQIRQTNILVKNKITAFRENPPTRAEAFNLAIDIESSSGEIHFQRMMSSKPETVVEKVFQKLNGDDKDHAKRLVNYMKSNDIKFFKPTT